MNTNDVVVRLLSKEANVRVLIADTTQLAREATRRHGTNGIATNVLAETLTAGILMGALLKIQQRVALKFEGNGPVRKAIVEADSYGHVRGYVAEPELAENPADSVAAALGRAGLLTVVKDLRLKELYEGIVPLETSYVDQDISHYLKQSEQIPSVVNIKVLVNDQNEIEAASGILVQSLPPHDDATLAFFENRLQEMPPLADMILSGKSLTEIGAQLFEEIEYIDLEHRPLEFRCECTRERTEKALMLLGRDELQEIVEQEGRAVLNCQFCHEEYVFEENEVRDIIESLEV